MNTKRIKELAALTDGELARKLPFRSLAMTLKPIGETTHTMNV